jgi:DNA-binding CsgD family transcriptional regulator
VPALNHALFKISGLVCWVKIPAAIAHLGESGQNSFIESERRAVSTQDISLLSGENVVVVYRLIEELCERGNDPRAWREYLVAELHRIFAAQLVISYLTKFELDHGNIAPKTLFYVEKGGNAAWRDYLARGDMLGDPISPFIQERFGTDFTFARHEFVDDETWHASDHFKNVLIPSNWDQAMYSNVGIIRPGVVDGIGVAKRLGEPAFTSRDVAMLRLIHQELARLWRKHDPLDAHTLPPRQREVLEGIRRGESRKMIAEKMGVSDHTVHSYEKALFDRAKVTSRMELLAILSKLVRPVLMP